MFSEVGIADKLLIAAFQIEMSGKRQFSAEDLVVFAWRRFPDAFGLKGYPNNEGKPLYPDSNRVYAEIMGSKPLRKQGLLKKVGSKLYTLTEAGRNRAKVIMNEADTQLSQKWALSREDQLSLRRLTDSRAVRKARQQKVDEISFYDACGFWGIYPGSNAKNLWERFAHIEGVLERSIEALGAREAASSQHRGAVYTAEGLKQLRLLHDLMRKKFASELERISKRTDERK